MEIQRTYTIVFEDDAGLRATLERFGEAKRAIRAVWFNEGTTLNQLKLHKEVYQHVRAMGLNAQMACNVIRSVSAAYSSATSNKRPATKAFGFHRAHAVFLVGVRGRAARFLEDGRLSISTVARRKKLH